MCKILVVPGVKPENEEKARKFIENAAGTMSLTPDNDGFGYASIYKDGSIYGEKWLKNDDAFKKRTPSEPSFGKRRLQEEFGEALKNVMKKEPVVYREFGKKGEGSPVSFLVHARKKTEGEVSLSNTHPFFEFEDKDHPDTVLIHNGTIKNHDKLADKKYSTCDSEAILHEYINRGMLYDMEKMDGLASELIGNYAVALMSTAWDSKNEEYFPVLDLFKSNKDLFCAYIEELETYVFATTKQIIESGCNKSGFKLVDETCYELEDGKYFRIDAETGQVLNIFEFVPSQTYEPTTTSTYPRNGGHHRPNNIMGLAGGTSNDDKNIEEIKRKFEENNQGLFLEYYSVNDLSDADKELIQALEANKDPENLNAVNLVKLTLMSKAN